MEESWCSRNTQEILGAAEQLMQLSNEDDGGTTTSSNVKQEEKQKKHKIGAEEEEVDQKRREIVTSICSKMEEIFGKDDDQDCNSIFRPKKRRYRSLQNIYLTTKPIINDRFAGKRITT